MNAERLDDLRFQLGADAGGLAYALDALTDVMNALALHKVHCRVEKGPRAGAAPLALEQALAELAEAKTLVQETMLRLRRDRPS